MTLTNNELSEIDFKNKSVVKEFRMYLTKYLKMIDENIISISLENLNHSSNSQDMNIFYYIDFSNYPSSELTNENFMKQITIPTSTVDSIKAVLTDSDLIYTFLNRHSFSKKTDGLVNLLFDAFNLDDSKSEDIGYFLSNLDSLDVEYDEDLFFSLKHSELNMTTINNYLKENNNERIKFLFLFSKNIEKKTIDLSDKLVFKIMFSKNNYTKSAWKIFTELKEYFRNVKISDDVPSNDDTKSLNVNYYNENNNENNEDNDENNTVLGHSPDIPELISDPYIKLDINYTEPEFTQFIDKNIKIYRGNKFPSDLYDYNNMLKKRYKSKKTDKMKNLLDLI